MQFENKMLGLSKKLLTLAVLATLFAASVCLEDAEEKPRANEDEYRLPKFVVPTSYDLKYSKVDFKSFTFTGDVKINVKVVEETKEIVLHKGNLTANVTAVSDEQGVKQAVVNISFNETTEKLTIKLKESLKPGSNVIVQLNFDGILRNDMIGFYRSSYVNERNKTIWLASTQFESTHARHAFPCFDEPALKAKFTISIVVPEGYGCLSNMPNKKNGNLCEFSESVPMSTYLVAFIVSDFASLSGKSLNPDIDVKVWARPNAVAQGKYGLDIAEQVLGYFINLIGAKYPLPKLDVVAVPDFSAGAMENWGLLTFRETASLYDQKESSAAAQQRVASVIVHECTHMWFGNLVTPEWWGYLWLSEAFARYYQYMATDEVESNWKMDQQFVVEQHQAALGVDALENSEPMTRTAITQSEIGRMGDSITYAKGASIVRMMELTFGSDVFNDAIRTYLKDRSFNTATPNDLWLALQNKLDPSKDPELNVTVAMKTWTEQPGFPYVSVNIKSDYIELSQARFFLRTIPNTIPTDTTWWVPISSMSAKTTEADTKPVFWLSKRNDKMKNPHKGDDWVVLNVLSTGFYRVKYDDDSWNRIINVLMSDDFEKIPELNRAAIVDDLLNLARAEIINYDLALRGIEYLKKETSYLPFKSAFTALDYLIRKYSDSDSQTFNDYVISLLKKVYEKLTYDDKAGDDRFTVLLRQEVNNRACSLAHDECIKKSQKYFSDWRTLNEPIPPNQRSAAYCTAIKYGTPEDWEFLWDQYQNANVAAEQTTILSALGCTKNTTLLEKYLLKALTSFEESRIRKQDISSVFSGVYSANLEGAEYILEFVDKHYDAIFKYYGSYDEIAGLVSGALQKYPTQKLADKLAALIESNATHLKSIKPSLQKTQKFVNFELDWHKQHSKTIIGWVEKNGEGSTTTTTTRPTTTLPPPSPNENTTDYRLPDDVIPMSYAIHLTPFIVPGNFTFRGTVKIIAKVVKQTEKIELHADQLITKKELVKVSQLNGNKPATELTVSSITSVDKYHFKVITMQEPIESDTNIVIEIEYAGTLNTEMRGFYRSSYKVDNQTRWLAATHLEPVGARRVFPCFDEPALKATFNLSVDVPKGYSAISNTNVKTTKDDVWVFETTPLMSTYLVALVVSDFKSKSEIVGDRTYSVWSNPLVAHQLDYSLKVMPPTVEWFEKHLKLPYQLPKMDMVALPDFSSGAMENWGLLTYRETNMLYDPVAMSSLSAKQSIRNVIAHEITHQWFGDLVSPLWWDYLWLSEGFARYFQYYARTEDEASWNLETQFVVDHLQTSFSNDASTSTHPVTHHVYSPTEIRAIFDTISYAKAASLIRMLEKLTGTEIFYAALHSYLKDAQYSNGTPEALFKAFQDQIKSDKSVDFDVTAFMNSWTRQSGFPVVNVTFKGKKASLSQSRFYLRPTKNDTRSKTTWIVPINWATRTNPNFTNTKTVTWFENDQQEIEINAANDDWVILNIQQTGYYRVNYDKTIWKRIISALNSENDRKLIPEINRASLIDDLLNLGRAGYIDYDLVLTGLSYLRHETEYGPWKAALTGLTYLNQRFAGRSEIYSTYKDYLFQLLEPRLKKLGFEEGKNDGHTDVLLRKLVLEWLCRFEHEECVNEARGLFERQRKDPKYAVPPNKHIFVYCTAVAHGTQDDWDYLWNKFVKSNYATEKITILTALACTKNSTNFDSLLRHAITSDSNIRFQDAKKIFTNVIDSGLGGVETTLDFIETNYLDMRTYFNDDSTTKSILSTLSKRLSTERLVEKFDSFVKNSAKTMPSIAKSLESSLKRAKLELSWYNKQAPNILKSLDVNNPQSGYRLPTFAKPLAYDIHLKPYFEERDFTFDGQVFIDVQVDENTWVVVLHQSNLDIKTIKLVGEEPVSNTVLSREYNETTHKLSLYFEKVLTAGTKLKLKFDYSGKLRDDMRGFYRSSYVDEKGKTKWIASTQFEPTYARRAFPCFDEPSFKATFTIHIAKPKGYHTLSNMGSSPAQRNDSGILWDDYKQSIKMSSYLVAFVVSDFVRVSKAPGTVSAWARPQLKGYMSYAPVVGRKALEFLEKFTQIPYPLDEMNLVAVPDFDMGAMENWGLVTFREYGLTYNVMTISASYLRYVSTVISHELVHMWFGDLVTCEWWDYTWLNEGFAEYLSYIVSNSTEPNWQLLKQFVVNELQVALGADSSSSSHPMNNKVVTPTEAQDGFDKIAYQKSASVLRMFHHSLGEGVFVEALHEYLNTHKYSTARPEYLVTAIQDRLSKEEQGAPGKLQVDFTTVMNSWITQPGYPLINVTRDGQKVILSQERFLLSSTNSSEKKRIYWTPITYTTETELNFESTTPRLWLGEDEQTIELRSNDTWFLLNIQEIGFYRVNYDLTTWKRLVELLNSDDFSKINELNRAQILDDSLNLARAGYLDFDVALNASKYLVRETSHLPLKAFLNALAYIGQRVEGHKETSKLYAQYVLALLDKIYKSLGFEENMIKDAHLDQLNRELVLVWACKYGHEDCKEQATKYFKGPNITPNIAVAVYCTAVEHGTSDDWDTLWKKYTTALLATDYITILKGLGCSKNITILESYLDRIIAPDSAIRRQDVGTAFSSVYTSSQVGLETAINYFQKNLEKLYKYYGEWHEVGSLFTSLAGRISTKEQIESLEKLANDDKASNIQSSLQSAVKSAKNNLKWYEQYSDKIHTWLEKNYGDEEITTPKDEPSSSTVTTPKDEPSSSTVSTSTETEGTTGSTTTTKNPDENKPGSASLPIVSVFVLILLNLISIYFTSY